MAKRLLKLTSPMMKGDDVKEFQTLVNAKGYSPGKIDGIYGNNSVSACKAFQKASGLAIDGMCGDRTWAALEGRRTLKKTSRSLSAWIVAVKPLLSRSKLEQDMLRRARQSAK